MTPPSESSAAAQPPAASLPDAIKSIADRVTSLQHTITDQRKTRADYFQRMNQIEGQLETLDRLGTIMKTARPPAAPSTPKEIVDPDEPAPAKVAAPKAAIAAKPDFILEPPRAAPMANPAPQPPVPAVPQSPKRVPKPQPRLTGPTPRQTYLGVAWVEHLAHQFGAGAVYVLLDYYRELGWIPRGPHAWLCQVAAGLGTRSEGFTIDTITADPDVLAKTHRTSLKILGAMFGDGLTRQERERIDTAVHQFFRGA